jgi:hypothetical protein
VELVADRGATQTYWVSQSPVTDPGPAAAAIDALPGDPAALREASSQLVFHFQTGGDFAENGVPAGRMAEINTRYADAMFALLMDRGGPALMRDRSAADRVVGCCRDVTVLFLAPATTGSAGSCPASLSVAPVRAPFADTDAREVADASGLL